MKFAIIENEEYALANLMKMIEGIRPEWRCLFTSETVEDSLIALQDPRHPDLIFMDIELDDGSCFEIFEKIDLKIPIIFTTAYSEFAIKAFKVNSVDYLLKPVDEIELIKAIQKFEERTPKKEQIDFHKLGEEISTTTRHRKRLLVSDNNGYSYIQIDEIAWFEAEDKYISIVTLEGRKRLTDLKSLSDISGILDPEDFFQISRSVIASIKSIDKVLKHFKGRLTVELKAGSLIQKETVSAARRTQFLDWLGHA